MLHRLAIVLVVMLAVMPGMSQQQDTVSASVQPAQVTVGDTVSYQVSIVISGSAQPSVKLPELDADSGLSDPVPAGQQSGVETYITNGSFRSIQRIVYSYAIRTSKVGKFTIPPATVTLNGRAVKTNAVTVDVRDISKATDVPDELEGLVAAPSVSGNPDLERKLTGVIFVLPVLSDTEPYNGEQVRISYHLVIDPDALKDANLLPRTNLDGYMVPPMNEFITEELYPFPQDLKFQERKIGGRLFLVAPVYEAVIASTKSGKLEIEPFQISMLFSTQGQRRTAFPNDPFFSTLGSPLGMMTGSAVRVIAQSPVLTLDVKPVPTEGRPADYNGAVGTFDIAVEVDRTKARAYDDTVELDVIVHGEGNTESLSPPTLPSLPGFTVLGEPEMTTAGQKDGDDYVSVKKFRYTLRPTTPGKVEIPPITMSYFEPEAEEFRKVESEEISLEIEPGTRPAPAMTVAADDEDEADEPEVEAEPDLRYIATGVLEEPGSIWGRITGGVLFLIPPSILAGAGLMAWARRRSERRRVDPKQQARAAYNQHMRSAQEALERGDHTAVASGVADGVRLFFGSRLGVAPAETTIQVIEDRLRRNSAPEELVSGVSRVLETCDSMRYAPAGHGWNVKEIYDEAQRLLKEAEKYV